MLGNVFHKFLMSADFFQIQLFQKILSEISTWCQTVWIQIRPDILSGLIWVQIVCKGYQQIYYMSLFSKERVKKTNSRVSDNAK